VSKSRAKIKTIIVINWLGIFYQEIEVDPLITGLEGGNGAGKTTLMATPYLVMMPDLQKVRITNVGESIGAQTETGLGGRLGASGYSYSILEVLDQTGERIFAGVQLESMKDREPQKGPMFVITGVPHGVAAEKLFLVASATNLSNSMVANISEIKQQVALYGGKLAAFDSIGDYGDVLYDHGIFPARLSDARKKDNLNRLIQTSIQGGFSKRLQERLKEYFLAPDPGEVKGSITQMQGALNQARMTKRMLENYSERMTDIKAIGAYAKRVVSSAVKYLVIKHREEYANLKDAGAKLIEARDKVKNLKQTIETLTKDLETLCQRQTECQKEFEAAEVALANATQAHKTAQEIDQAKKERVTLEASVKGLEHQLREAGKELQEAERGFTSCENKIATLSDVIATKEAAWRKIFREAAAYESAQEALREATIRVPERSMSPSTAEDELIRCGELTRGANARKGHIEQQLDQAEGNQKAFETALRPLLALSPGVTPESAYVQAQAVDLQFREMERLIAGKDELEARIRETTDRANRQAAIRNALAPLVQQDILIKSRGDLERWTDHLEEQVSALAKTLDDAGELLAQQEEERRGKQSAMKTLEGEVARYTQAKHWQEGVRTRHGRSMDNENDRLQLLEEKRRDAGSARDKHIHLEHVARALKEKVQLLEDSASSANPRTEEIAKILGAKTFSSIHEDIDPDLAGETQARLGPLSQGLLVDNLSAALEKLWDIEDMPDELWLTEQGDLDRHPRKMKTRLSAELVIADMGGATRVTRIPETPTLGFAARDRLIRRLNAELHETRTQITAQAKTVRDLDADIDTLNKGQEEMVILSKGDPHIRLTLLEGEVVELSRMISKTKGVLASAKTEKAGKESILKTLRKWEHAAIYLDAEEYRESLSVLEKQKATLTDTLHQVEKASPDLMLLRQHMNALRTLPLSEKAKADLQQDLAELQQQIDLLYDRKQCLERLADHHLRGDFLFEESYRQRQELGKRSEEAELTELKQQLEGAQREKAAAKALREVKETAKKAIDDKLNNEQPRLNFLNISLDEREKTLLGLGLTGSREELDQAQQAKNRTETRKVEVDSRVKQEETNLATIRGGLSGLESDETKCRDVLDTAKKAFVQVNIPYRDCKTTIKQSTTAQFWYDDENGQTNPITIYNQITESLSGLKTFLANRIQTAGREQSYTDTLTHLKDEAAKLVTENKQGLLINGRDYLEFWTHAVEKFISQAVPAGAVQTSDPTEALVEMEIQLKALKNTLADHEEQFRSDSAGIARSIKGRISRERKKITAANRGLSMVTFGNITGIKIQVDQNETLHQLLDAMQDAKQFGLFTDQDAPLQEAMSMLYQKITGQPHAVQGDLLLDYSNYLDLTVKIQRSGGQRWETASPTKLSTGESMGLGSAILLSIIQAWEEQGADIRSRNRSLRFLPIDEAVRLDAKSLKTLVDFCSRLDIQLLVAGPSFADGGCGKGVTYRVTREAKEGPDQVLVRGYRWKKTEAELLGEEV